MNKSITLLIVLSIILFSCNKRIDHYETYYVHADMVNNFHFKVGSYWIYKNATTAEIDSVYVVQNLLDECYWENGISSNPNYRWYNTSIIIRDSLEENPIVNNIWLEQYCISFDYKPCSNSYDYPNCQFNHFTDTVSYKYHEYIDTVFTDSNTVFWGVYKLSQLFGGSNNQPRDTLIYYLKKKIGIVRKEIKTHNGEVTQYNLIRFQTQ